MNKAYIWTSFLTVGSAIKRCKSYKTTTAAPALVSTILIPSHMMQKITRMRLSLKTACTVETT